MSATESEIGAAYRAGYRGKPIPDNVAGDSFAVAAHDQGVNDREYGLPMDDRLGNLGRSSSASAAPANPAKPKAAPAKGNTKAPAKKKPGYLSRAFSPKAGAQRAYKATGAPKLVSSGDGGGLFLALILYPLLLATIQHGAAGPGLWFKAKWLNQTKGAADNLGTASYDQQNAKLPGQQGVPPGYHRGTIPGTRAS